MSKYPSLVYSWTVEFLIERDKMTVRQAVSGDPEILGGMLVLDGTRGPVGSLFDDLEVSSSVDSFPESYNWSSREQVNAVLANSAERLEQPAN